MDIYRFKVHVNLKKDVHIKDMRMCLANLIDKCLCLSEEGKVIHEENRLKLYTFGILMPMPFEKEKTNMVYKASTEKDCVSYYFNIRTPLRELYALFYKNLRTTETAEFEKVYVQRETITMDEGPITNIISASPAIFRKKDTHYWRNDSNGVIMTGSTAKEAEREYLERLVENLSAKYHAITKEKINVTVDDVIENYSFANAGPIVSLGKKKYKEEVVAEKESDIRLLGDKPVLTFKENENAQKLVKVAIATGIMQLNARGFGFVSYGRKEVS